MLEARYWAKSQGMCRDISSTENTAQTDKWPKTREPFLTFIALMADLVMEIIFAREIGGLESIRENN